VLRDLDRGEQDHIARATLAAKLAAPDAGA
jgi:hypothetical protein